MTCHWRIVLCVIAIFASVSAKIFTPNEFAGILHSQNITDWDIPALVCVAHNVSGLNSSFVKETYEKDLDMNVTLFGIFGLSEHEVNCDASSEQLTDDDVVNDIHCAIEILTSGLTYHHAISGSFEYLFGHSRVDVNRCFNWWEDLPPFIFREEEQPNREMPESVTTTPATKPPHQPKPDKHPPITRTCNCEYQNSSIMFNISLIWLNLTLLLLGYILYTAFRQNKRFNTSTTDDTAYLCSDLDHD